MEQINLKILPFVASAIIFSYFTFATALSLITKVEIMLNLEQVLVFILILALHISLTAISLAFIFSQLANIYYRIATFFILFLPYASVFLLQNQLDIQTMLMLLVIFVALAFSAILEFNSSYSNQIKTKIETPARANAKTITFYIALATALVFFTVNNNPESQLQLQTKIEDILTTTITTTIEDYDLEQLIGSQIPAGLETTPMGRTAMNQVESQFKDMITEQIVTMISPYMPYIIYILTFLIFGTIAGATTFVGIVTIVVGMTSTQILKSSGYIKETKQMIEVTRFTL